MSLNLQSDDFSLMNLPRRFALDTAALDAQWKALQAQVHPDRHASEGAAAQRQAMQWAVRVNEAYQRLKDPMSRAAYLCELAGEAIDAERNTAMPPAFLMQQMAWREQAEEADGADALADLHDEVLAERRRRIGQLGALIDEKQDCKSAAAQVRALMFIERFAAELDRRLEALGQ